MPEPTELAFLLADAGVSAASLTILFHNGGWRYLDIIKAFRGPPSSRRERLIKFGLTATPVALLSTLVVKDALLVAQEATARESSATLRSSHAVEAATIFGSLVEVSDPLVTFTMTLFVAHWSSGEFSWLLGKSARTPRQAAWWVIVGTGLLIADAVRLLVVASSSLPAATMAAASSVISLASATVALAATALLYLTLNTIRNVLREARGRDPADLTVHALATRQSNLEATPGSNASVFGATVDYLAAIQGLSSIYRSGVTLALLSTLRALGVVALNTVGGTVSGSVAEQCLTLFVALCTATMAPLMIKTAIPNNDNLFCEILKRAVGSQSLSYTNTAEATFSSTSVVTPCGRASSESQRLLSRTTICTPSIPISPPQRHSSEERTQLRKPRPSSIVVTSPFTSDALVVISGGAHSQRRRAISTLESSRPLSGMHMSNSAACHIPIAPDTATTKSVAPNQQPVEDNSANGNVFRPILRRQQPAHSGTDNRWKRHSYAGRLSISSLLSSSAPSAFSQHIRQPQQSQQKRAIAVAAGSNRYSYHTGHTDAVTEDNSRRHNAFTITVRADTPRYSHLQHPHQQEGHWQRQPEAALQLQLNLSHNKDDEHHEDVINMTPITRQGQFVAINTTRPRPPVPPTPLDSQHHPVTTVSAFPSPAHEPAESAHTTGAAVIEAGGLEHHHQHYLLQQQLEVEDEEISVQTTGEGRRANLLQSNLQTRNLSALVEAFHDNQPEQSDSRASSLAGNTHSVAQGPPVTPLGQPPVGRPALFLGRSNHLTPINSPPPSPASYRRGTVNSSSVEDDYDAKHQTQRQDILTPPQTPTTCANQLAHSINSSRQLQLPPVLRIRAAETHRPVSQGPSDSSESVAPTTTSPIRWTSSASIERAVPLGAMTVTAVISSDSLTNGQPEAPSPTKPSRYNSVFIPSSGYVGSLRLVGMNVTSGDRAEQQSPCHQKTDSLATIKLPTSVAVPSKVSRALVNSTMRRQFFDTTRQVLASQIETTTTPVSEGMKVQRRRQQQKQSMVAIDTSRLVGWVSKHALVRDLASVGKSWLEYHAGSQLNTTSTLLAKETLTRVSQYLARKNRTGSNSSGKYRLVVYTPQVGDGVETAADNAARQGSGKVARPRLILVIMGTGAPSLGQQVEDSRYLTPIAKQMVAALAFRASANLLQWGTSTWRNVDEALAISISSCSGGGGGYAMVPLLRNQMIPSLSLLSLPRLLSRASNGSTAGKKSSISLEPTSDGDYILWFKACSQGLTSPGGRRGQRAGASDFHEIVVQQSVAAATAGGSGGRRGSTGPDSGGHHNDEGADGHDAYPVRWVGNPRFSLFSLPTSVLRAPQLPPSPLSEAEPESDDDSTRDGGSQDDDDSDAS